MSEKEKHPAQTNPITVKIHNSDGTTTHRFGLAGKLEGMPKPKTASNNPPPLPGSAKGGG